MQVTCGGRGEKIFTTEEHGGGTEFHRENLLIQAESPVYFNPMATPRVIDIMKIMLQRSNMFVALGFIPGNMTKRR